MRAEILFEPWSASAFVEAATRDMRAALAAHRPIALVGAGQTGSQMAALLGDAACCFLDDTPAKQGTQIGGLPVHPVEAGLQALPDDAVVVVCIFSARHSFALTRERLQRVRALEVYPFAALLHTLGTGLPNLYLGDIAHQVAQQPRYRRLHAALADDASRRVLDDHLRMRLLADFSALPDSRCELDFLGLEDSARPAFVDGGAFDGDTVAEFLAWRGDRFSQVVAFEPDLANYRRMVQRVQALPPALRERIALRRAALWSHAGEVSFDSTGHVGSAVSVQGAPAVPADTLASVQHLSDPVLVKLDVEGAEREVLQGAQAFIRARRPLLAVSVYHRPDDLLDLFELVEELAPGSRYHLRCHGGDGSDLTLYAVAADTLRTAAATSATSAAPR